MLNPNLIKIADLNLSKELKYVLCQRLALITLQDLLDIDYSVLLKTRKMGKKRMEELEKCVESFGVTLKGYPNSLQCMKEKKKSQGVKLLEEWGFSLRLCSPLYKNNIFTLEDLLACGKNVYSLKGIGVKNNLAIWKKMQELNIPFPKPFTAIEQLDKENDETRKLKAKKTLLTKYKYANQLNKEFQKEQKQPLYSILINGKGGVTYLYDNTVSEGLDAKSMMGFLIHCNSIKELVAQIPIYKYYVLDAKEEILEITKEQAEFLYDQILDYVLKKQGWRK